MSAESAPNQRRMSAESRRANRQVVSMKAFHKKMRKEVVDYLRALYFAQPKADWDTLAVGNFVLHKGYGSRIVHVPPKRGFVMATDVATGEAEKLLRSRYATPDLLVTDEGTLAVLRTSHREEIRKAMAAGTSISLHVQYDYPELFAPYPESWDEKRRKKARTLGADQRNVGVPRQPRPSRLAVRQGRSPDCRG